SQAFRPNKMKDVKLFSPELLLNIVLNITTATLIVTFFGWQALAYLALSTFIGLGMHPTGGRWIQEHYITREGQETYSYYGILNKFCFNIGYHNEHHDFMNVPWNLLPEIKKMAPE